MVLIEKISDTLNAALWGPFMLAVIFAVSLYFTVGCNFFQFHIWFVIKNTIGTLFKTKNKNSISPFSALTTALSGSVGIGNIVGVTTAISLGGAGAIFWMWVSAVLGMIVKYAEIVLAMLYRFKDKDGNYKGGAVYYIKNGVGIKPLAYFYAVMGLLVSFGMGNMVQANAMACAAKTSFKIPQAVTGIVFAIIIAVIMSGGIKRIFSITSFIIPVMSFLFIAASLAVILFNLPALPKVIYEIFRSAFDIHSIAGGAAGAGMYQAIKLGCARGIFSNEAGLGTSSPSHAASPEKSAVKQGLWGMMEVFIDTIVLCSFTAFSVLCSGADKKDLNGVDTAIYAYRSVLGPFGEYFITFSLIVFAFSTIIAWSFYGESYWHFLFGSSKIVYYRIFFGVFLMIGSVFGLNLVWKLSDAFNGLIIIPNLIGILALSGEVVNETKHYFKMNIH
ncbi:MAG: sodium:alanine symporter family protein [Bacillota bacterium]|nr:sodium:alanine symporter family protein [Bacillota bacterium]